MRRFLTPVAIALIGLCVAVSSTSAQQKKKLPGPGRGPLPKLRITGISQQGNLARVVIRNDNNFGVSGRALRMQVFRGGRLIGTIQTSAGGIPAGRSRAVLMRTNVRLGLPGTVLAFQGRGLNAVFLRNGLNNAFLRSSRPLGAVLAGGKGVIGRPGKTGPKVDAGGEEEQAEAAARKAELAAKKAEAAKKGAEKAKEEAEAVVEGEVEGEPEGN